MCNSPTKAQPRNAELLIAIRDLGKVNVPDKAPHSQKAADNISVTLFGIIREPEILVCQKARSPILVIFSGKTKRIRVDFPSNALYGISLAAELPYFAISTSRRLSDCKAVISSRIISKSRWSMVPVTLRFLTFV